MKGIFCSFVVLVLMLFTNYTLISQGRSEGNSNEYFISVTESKQHNNMEDSIYWFKTNQYNLDLHNVDENIFIFYRGVSRFASFQTYHGSEYELKLGIQDFFQVLTSGENHNYYFTDRSLLYIAASFMEILDNNNEMAPRLFTYFLENASPDHPYYITAMYWATYLKFLDLDTYTRYYETLSDLGKAKNTLIYDYLSSTTKKLEKMVSRLENPAKVSLHQYRWIKDNMDIMTLLTGTIVTENIYDNPDIPTALVQNQRYVITPTSTPFRRNPFDPYSGSDTPLQTGDGSTPVEEQTSNTSLSTTRAPLAQPQQNQTLNNNRYRATTTVPRTTPQYTPPPMRTVQPQYTPPPMRSGQNNYTTQQINTLRDSFKLIIQKYNDNIPLKVEILGRSISTATSKNYTVFINSGRYNIITTYNNRVYTNTLNVIQGKQNIVTIIAKSPNADIEYSEYFLTAKGEMKIDSPLFAGYSAHNINHLLEYLITRYVGQELEETKSYSDNNSVPVIYSENNTINDSTENINKEYLTQGHSESMEWFKLYDEKYINVKRQRNVYYKQFAVTKNTPYVTQSK